MSLYLRPFATCTDPNLGLGSSGKSIVCVVTSPCPPLFGSNVEPVKVFLDEEHVRAWPGGAGHLKISSNYAPAVLPQVGEHKKKFSIQL